MSGKNKFDRFAWLLNGLAKLLALIPNKLRWLLWDLTSPFEGSVSIGLRYAIAKTTFESVGDNVFFGRWVSIKNGHLLTIGKNVSIHSLCYLDLAGECVIGNEVSIAHNTSIVTFNHTWGQKDVPIKYNPTELGKVIIEDDVWIGCGVRIMPGVVIATRSIVAAGAVVNRDVASSTIVGGVPAKTIGQISVKKPQP